MSLEKGKEQSIVPWECMPTSQNGNYLGTKRTNIVKDAGGKKKPLYAASINITDSVSLKIRMEVHQNLRMDLSCDSVVSFLSI